MEKTDLERREEEEQIELHSKSRTELKKQKRGLLLSYLIFWRKGPGCARNKQACAKFSLTVSKSKSVYTYFKWPHTKAERKASHQREGRDAMNRTNRDNNALFRTVSPRRYSLCCENVMKLGHLYSNLFLV